MKNKITRISTYMLKHTRTLSLSFLLALFMLVGSVGVQKADALTTISSNLTLGSKGADVTTLQTFLAQDPSVYPSGLVTGTYGTLTQAAVQAFQAKYGIVSSGTAATTGYGSVGPQTRAKINELIAGGTTTGGSVSGMAPMIWNATSTMQNTNTSGGVASSTALVSWQTDRATRGKVFYSTIPLVMTENNSPTSEPTISGNVITDDSYTTSKSMTIQNPWNNGTAGTYYYAIEAIDANGNVSVAWPQAITVSGSSMNQ